MKAFQMKTLTRPMRLRDIPPPERVRALLAQMGTTIRASDVAPIAKDHDERVKHQRWRRQGMSIPQMAKRAKVAVARVRKVMGEME